MEQVSHKGKTGHHHSVHHVLAHSYTFYFALFLMGVFLDLVFPIKVFSSVVMTEIGILLLFLSSFLILWAQNTSRNLQVHHVTKETFLGGPYSFTRSPTHWGLFFLTLGFGIIVNSFFIILFTVISFVVTKLIFLKQEEALLLDKYGEPYLEYQKLVRN